MTSGWSKLTVADLRVELKKRGLPQAGKKADLIERLESATSDENHDDVAPVTNEDEQDTKKPEEAVANPQAGTAPPTGMQSPNSPAIVPATEISDAGGNSASPSKVPADPGRVAPATESVEGLPKSDLSSDPHRGSAAQGGKEDSERFENTSLVAEVAQDTLSRKRRSRSPPPSEEEASRKRARQSDQVSHDVEMHEQTAEANGHTPRSFRATSPVRDRRPSHDRDRDMTDFREKDVDRGQEREDGEDTRTRSDYDGAAHKATEDDGKVAPALHPATSALYVKNFMRPLREAQLKDYLVDLTTPPGSDPDPDVVVDFYLDNIRTHAFVEFASVQAASRVRVALHGKVWPDERNRKGLWVDFIPPEKVREWIDMELDGGGRGSLNRYEVVYNIDDDGNTVARLANAEAEPSRPPHVGPAEHSPTIPTGPALTYPGIVGAPSGPRRSAHVRQPPLATGGEAWIGTHARPSLLYQPVPKDLADRRLTNMRAHFTRDVHRDMGREDEINRYTFESGDQFRDRGKEVFIGIRPPHRERERRQMGLRPGDRAPPLPLRSAFRGGRGGSRRDDGPPRPPRSRFDGAPLPTWGGGGGGGRDRWDNRRGGGGYRY